MLMPAAVLIVLLLGAIAVDSAIVYLGQRQAYNAAFDAANDAAGAGIDAGLARETGEIAYDAARVEELARAAIEASGIQDLRMIDTVIDGDEVAVTVEIEIDHLFIQAFGRDGAEAIRITARAGGQTQGP